MIEAVDTRLREWMEGVTPQASISLAAPAAVSDTPCVSLYLLALRTVSQDRTLPKRIFDLELEYLVTAWADDPAEEHALLGQLLLEASQDDGCHLELDPPGDALWSAFGIAPRPSLRLRTMARHDFPERPVHRVETVEFHGGPLHTLRSRLVDPEDRPVVGARIELRGGRAPVRSSGRGEFSLRVPVDSERPLALVIRAKGVERRWRVAAGEWPERFVFPFDDPEEEK